MKWEELTAPEFKKAVAEVGGVCVLPLGIMEKHGEHLPLGTDLYCARALAEEAVRREPAILFPPYYFGQIHEARHQPGAVALPSCLFFELLETVCGEIARNGLKKIVLVNGHGGNNAFLTFFLQTMLERERDYFLYLAQGGDGGPKWKALRETTQDGHAGESETSAMLALRPDLVKMEAIGGDGTPRKRMAHLQGASSGIWWYADFPDHYAGDGAYGTAEKGRAMFEYETEQLADLIRRVKADTQVPALTREFYGRTQHDK